MNICHGHPYGDIARTVYLTKMTPVPAAIPNAEYLLQMKKRAIDLYLKEMGVGREHLADWLLIHAAARLAELSIEQADEQNSVLHICQQGDYDEFIFKIEDETMQIGRFDKTNSVLINEAAELLIESFSYSYADCTLCFG